MNGENENCIELSSDSENSEFKSKRRRLKKEKKLKKKNISIDEGSISDIIESEDDFIMDNVIEIEDNNNNVQNIDDKTKTKKNDTINVTSGKIPIMKLKDLSGIHEIQSIEDAKYVGKNGNKEVIINFTILVLNKSTNKFYNIKLTNKHLKLYAPSLLCDFYEKRLSNPSKAH